MRSELRDVLAARAAMAAASRTQRLLRSPIRAAVAKAATVIGNSTGRSFRAEAKTFWGERMSVTLPEPLSADLYRYGFFERGLTELLLTYLRPNMTFFDVGAHFGYFTLLGAHLVGRGGSVHSFEPTPTTFSVLEANTSHLPEVTLNPVAVWSRCEELTFRDFGVRLSMYNSLFAPRLSDQDAARASASFITVPAVSLDHYVATSGAIPHFVKVDAESAEREVLQGMKETIRRHRPIISIEVGDYNVAGAASSRELLASVIAKGYRALEFRDGKIVKHRLRERYRYDNILLLPR